MNLVETTDSMEPNFGHKVWQLVQRVAPQLLMGTAALALAVFAALHKPWNGVLFAAGLSLTLWAILLEGSRRGALEKLEADLALARSQLSTANGRVTDLCNEVKATSYEMLVALSDLYVGDPNDLRVSVYVRQDENWVRLGRHSARSRYRESGRATIPLEEGLLHRAYDRSRADAKGLPDRERDAVRYDEEQNRLGLRKGASPGLVMAPRSYALFRIDSRPAATPGATFVLCFESTRPQGLELTELEKLVAPWTCAIHLVFTRVFEVHETAGE